MEGVQVLEDREGIERAIDQVMGRLGLGCRASDGSLLVVSPLSARREPSGRYRTVLLPGDAPVAAGREAASVVTYGLSPRDTLTLSSQQGPLLWVAVQRQLVTVDGRVVERQEFPARVGAHLGEQAALAVTGALLLLGAPPEQLCS